MDKREQNLIDTLTLRSMSKAEYTTDNIGHYGLAFLIIPILLPQYDDIPTLWFTAYYKII